MALQLGPATKYHPSKYLLGRYGDNCPWSLKTTIGSSLTPQRHTHRQPPKIPRERLCRVTPCHRYCTLQCLPSLGTWVPTVGTLRLPYVYLPTLGTLSHNACYVSSRTRVPCCPVVESPPTHSIIVTIASAVSSKHHTIRCSIPLDNLRPVSQAPLVSCKGSRQVPKSTFIQWLSLFPVLEAFLCSCNKRLLRFMCRSSQSSTGPPFRVTYNFAPTYSTYSLCVECIEMPWHHLSGRQIHGVQVGKL